MIFDPTAFAICPGPKARQAAGQIGQLGLRGPARGHLGRKHGQAGRKLFSGMLGRSSGQLVVCHPCLRAL